ncbi:MAG: adenosylmethionine decarboxylase [Salibacteraceae bacterium]|nr:adenosylmethionine decarboxylase [Salibacteraceae bacterium]
MEGLGLHILMEFYDCSPTVLDDEKRLEELMLEAAEKASATIIKSVFHKFSPQGVTGVVVVAESHLAIHTWPENQYAAVDFFTCNDKMDHEKAQLHLKNGLLSNREVIKLVARGTEISEDIKK